MVMQDSQAPSSGIPGTYCSGVLIAPRVTTISGCNSCPNGGGSCIASPLDLGNPTDRLILTLYGTGFKGFSGLQNVSATIGTAMAQVLYVGPQGQFAGLDQVNLVVPRSLAGSGEVPIILTIDGQTANVVTINVK